MACNLIFNLCHHSSSNDVRTLTGHCGSVFSLSFNIDNTFLLSASEDGTGVWVWVWVHVGVRGCGCVGCVWGGGGAALARVGECMCVAVCVCVYVSYLLIFLLFH